MRPDSYMNQGRPAASQRAIERLLTRVEGLFGEPISEYAFLHMLAHAQPLPADHPFWHTPGITVTPHISGPSVPAEVGEYFAAEYQRYVSGQPLTGLVDRQRGY